MKIKELYLKNFRCFEETKIDFNTDYTIFVGVNGAGKSSILNAIQILLYPIIIASYNDNRRGLCYCNLKEINILKESDITTKTKQMGSIFNQELQYPMILKSVLQESDDMEIPLEYKLDKNYINTPIETEPLIRYVRYLQNQVTEDEKTILPVIAYYGTKRQWEKREENTQEILFMPQMNGYTNALSAEPFNITKMRHWFSRMLLISRKKPVLEFEAVRNAISNCYKEIDDREELQEVKIDYDAEKEDIEIQMYFEDKIEILPLNYLSDGMKSILAIVSDIAYRMATLNPNLLGDVIKETDGIVMIDEIDMHLHPSWQRKIVNSLTKTFPKVQFIFTTHSPTVLTNVPKENIKIVSNGNIFDTNINTYGRDVNSILREIMHSKIRPSETQKILDDFSDSIADSDLEKAEKTLEELKRILGENDSEVVNAQVTLDLEKI